MMVLAISGSLRADSYNTRLLRAAAEEAPAGVEVELWDGLESVPPYTVEAEGEAPLAVERLRHAIAGADAVLFATPEYNASIPGQLKNALDWVSRPFATNALRGKPVAVVGSSTGSFGAVWAQADLRRVAGAMGARVVGEELPVALAHERFDESGALVDEELRARLRDVVAGLASEAAPAAASMAA